ncbi:conserved hypothetical protein [Leishmania mexicana MHOM/GT/2001/U1103]|uniref:C2 domain-containing protein n=1 Tax=Leishmania mexicana (strain MHOM/GT/2001/U1103) TaxID=929439 RepID=E9AM41_LEIMU|nr:conserved hypothetical protein [Leishmania mexicana MHOM/GT/2001/U1103]CBZ23996.1 conserved hypothetical protein [Leishmania mexicana MHOM/GT/2001/U1103]
MQRHTATVTVTPQRELEDRLQRALHENSILKLQKNELEEKLKKVQTQFRRLAADWRRAQESGAVVPPDSASSPCSAALPVRPHSAAEAVIRGSPAAPSLRRLLPPLNPNQPAHVSAGTSSETAKHFKKEGSSPNFTTAAPGVSEAELAACKAALAHAQLELQQVRAAALAAAKARTTALAASSNATIRSADASAATLAAAKQEAAQLRSQLQQVREELNAALLGQQQLQVQSSQAVQGLQQQLEAHYRASIGTLAREKQELSVKVRLMEAERQATNTVEAGGPDPMEMVTLHGEVHRKASEATLLNSRLQYAQGQVETLKGECNRLIEELKEAHTAHADTKRALFTVEHEAASLRTRCGSMDELELALQRKTAECTNIEQELLKLVGSLQTCQRETETAVRSEFGSRLTEVQEMRDTAERERREVERKLLNCQHDLAELRRRLESTQEDLQLYRGQVAKLEKEKSVMSAQIAFAGHTATAAAAAGADLTDDDVHRALAVAAIKKRGSRIPKREVDMGGAGGATTDGGATATSQGAADAAGATPAKEAREALDLFEALSWDGDWEQGQMREALATAAMDLELAETRCQQMAEQVEQSREMLRKVSDERDILLEESIALRGRVAHVQTIFAKQQLQAYRAAATASGLDAEGLITFSIRGLQSQEAAMCRSLGIANLKAPVSFFFTLEGLADYEAMVGPTLRALDDVVDVRFQYEGLAKDAVTLAAIEQTTFCFQLHCAAGETSRLVAMAELPGASLLNAREVPVEDTLNLIDGEGQKVGSILVEFCCARLVLPILLGAPLSDPRAGATSFTLSAQEIKGAMVALRTVCYLRIQVFRAEGLGGSAEAGTAPQPYVFYTASSPLGALNCVRDTVVHPSSRAFTTDPVFDAMPVDHRVIVDPALIRFVAFGVVSFVLFDERATNVQSNLGVVEVALRPLLNSPHATIRVTEKLHPQGTLSVGLSWVSGV